ncbi:hypothetical protein LEM8419_01835 [Neolewinella maritima]|uniref:Lipoprotein n=1 Tax=Neolewinella maritima TaxID=1383882 RepID=A0ABN8F1T1_9BACT|nr:hypothetical protein [Neolewinella maritima]CAH1000701.1 hypothetical protein LEM8419_01835 [Neolewinella maritima]
MKRTFHLFLLASLGVLLGLLPACTPDQEERGIAAEQAYVDLLYALQRDDQAGSLDKVRALDHSIRQLRRQWYRPMSEQELDDMRYHVDLAECAYQDAYASIEEGDLDQAMVQLDRAVYELAAGDAASLHELYVGSIHDFISVWLEIDYILRHEGCHFDWQTVANCGRDARATWRQVRGYTPDDYLYYDRLVDPQAFTAAHMALDAEVAAFHRTLKSRDKCLVHDQGNAVSEALWGLLLLFGSPEPPPPAEEEGHNL